MAQRDIANTVAGSENHGEYRGKVRGEILSEVLMASLGVVWEGGRSRFLYGPYILEDRGYLDEDGDPSACWIWCGRYKNGRPVIQTRFSNYSPKAMIFRRVGRPRGIAENLCGHVDCIRPGHMRTITYSELGKSGAAVRWGKMSG